LWSETEDPGLGHAVGFHLGHDVVDVRVPVAHADVDRSADMLLQEFGLSQGPTGQGRLFGQRFVAQADFSVAVLEFFDDVLGHGAAVGDFGEVFGHVVEDVGGTVGEEEDSFRHRADSMVSAAPLGSSACGNPGGRLQSYTRKMPQLRHVRLRFLRVCSDYRPLHSFRGLSDKGFLCPQL